MSEKMSEFAYNRHFRHYLPFDLRKLTKEIKEKAEKELGETDEVREETLKRMKKLMKEDSKLSCPTDDNYILIHLRRNKFNVDRTFKQLTKALRIRTRADIFERNFPRFRGLVEDEFMYVLPNRDYDGSVITVIQLDKWNPQKYAPDEVIGYICQLAFGLADVHEATQICGIKCIIDPRGMSFDHIKHISLKILKYVYIGSTNVFPVRISGVHVISGNFVVHYAWNIFKLWLTPKIKKRVVIHSENSNSLLNYFDAELLPIQYGGTIKFDVTENLEILDGTRDRYNYMWTARYDS